MEDNYLDILKRSYIESYKEDKYYAESLAADIEITH
ncbi:Protein of unknown function [Bacillus cytotoxicus]|uniref:Uncharacterized protein n=1 Tax=Bacillus cytotoxicus TaxID=580165 RepID=A0AAX2CNI0_9BACI|nr:Protein of unknown function [Bacillus cytotoxicus]